jgi:mono/diheme cytochrome c family protein
MRAMYWGVICVVMAVSQLPGMALGAGDSAKGKAKFQEVCAACHGELGKGDGPAAAGLPTKPRNLSDAAYMGKLKDQQIFDTIKKGGQAMGKSPLMPAWAGQLSDAQIRDLVAYIRTLSRKH